MNLLESDLELEKSKTICFTGLRPKKFDYGDTERTKLLFSETVLQILIHHKLGYDTFLHGGCAGFDILSAKAVIYAKRILPQINLVCVLPYDDFSESKEFNDYWRNQYISMLKHCNYVLNPYHKKYHYQGCYMKRNKFLIDHSNLCICMFDGQAGGTANTVDYAKQKGVDIINVLECV